MSWNATQICILGISVDIEDIKIIDAAEQRETQNRYDTKTGKVIKTESVVIKEEEYHYEWRGCREDNLYELVNNIQKKYGLYCRHDNEYEEDGQFYIGYKIGCKTDLGNIELLEGSTSLDDLMEMVKELREKLGNMDMISLHFSYYAG